jgi:hypothetical protein
MRSARREENLGLRILLLAALVFVVLPAAAVGLYFIDHALESREEPAPRREPYRSPLERALARLARPKEEAELRRAADEAERAEAREAALRVLRLACAEAEDPALYLIRILNTLRSQCDPGSEHDRACRRLAFGQCVRLLREGREEEALSRLWHLGSPDGLAPDYDYVCMHLRSDLYDEAVEAAAEALKVREQAGVPDLAAHLEFYAWLLERAGRHDEARAVASRLAEDPPPAGEPEREEQAANDARPR